MKYGKPRPPAPSRQRRLTHVADPAMVSGLRLVDPPSVANRGLDAVSNAAVATFNRPSIYVTAVVGQLTRRSQRAEGSGLTLRMTIAQGETAVLA